MIRTELSSQYINLLKKSLLNELYIENELRLLHTFKCMINKLPLNYADFFNVKHVQRDLFDALKHAKRTGDSVLLTVVAPDGNVVPLPNMRNITELSHTMIGELRLDNLRYCIETVLTDGIEGDFIETGIWRGGACIFARGILMAYGVTDRIIWCADSFQGVPAPTHPEDEGLDISAKVLPILAVPLVEVQELFARYGLLDNQVRFLEGWFKDTLAESPIERLAILRLDGDLYESTWDALAPLYDKVSPGGFIIVDDFDSCPPCKRAIDEFRARYGIDAEMVQIDDQSVFWRKR